MASREHGAYRTLDAVILMGSNVIRFETRFANLHHAPFRTPLE